MKISDVIKRALENKEIIELVNNGFVLGSCFVSLDSYKNPDSWILNFFSGKKVIDFKVSDNIEKGEESEALNKMKPLEYSNDFIDFEKVMSKIKKIKNPIKVLVFLHRKEKPLWTVNVVGSDMKAFSTEINALSGEIMNEKTINLVERISRGS